MTISDKTRKALWGKSGNLCAFCKCLLVMDSTQTDRESIIGEECHIVARNPGGARSDPSFPQEELDSYENLILLCSIHHKMIDDRPVEFSVENLRKLKTKHEKWVRERLVKTGGKQNQGTDHKIVLPRITDGKGILSVINNAHAYTKDYPEPNDEKELEMISTFFDQAEFYGDFGRELEASDVIRAGYDFSRHLKDLEAAGLYVYGRHYKTQMVVNRKPMDWNVAILIISRNLYKGLIMKRDDLDLGSMFN